MTIKEVYKNIYLAELSLPRNPLKYLNVYVIKGQDRSMIIDTGFNDDETKTEMANLMEELELKPEKTILYLTHLHSDHTGLASYLQAKGMEVLISRTDGEMLNNSVSLEDVEWQNTIRQGMLQGMKEEGLEIENHPGYKFRPTERIDYTPAIPGDHIEIGDYDFEIVDLKGHTPGITGLYEARYKILFCGDHILGKITPNITFWGFEYGDMLGTYLASLNYVYNMEVDHLFSSHRQLVDDHRARILELYNHHERRLEEAREALRKTGKVTVVEVARQLHWDIRSRSWEEFPKAQKWFAAGEAHAHLEHLRALGQANMEEVNGVLYYSAPSL